MPPVIILTDESGNPTGSMDIVAAHTAPGHLHKAFSIYIFRNNRKEILIQKRSATKMLWPLIWANTCCSHPREHESPLEAGARRLREECGFTCPLTDSGSFVYRAEDPEGRGVEHEHVTLLVGNLENDLSLHPNPDEIAELKWIAIDVLQEDMKKHPEHYAPWFHLGLKKTLVSLANNLAI